MSENTQSSEARLLDHIAKLQGAVLSYRICGEDDADAAAKEVERITEELWTLLVPEDHMDWNCMPDCAELVKTQEELPRLRDVEVKAKALVEQWTTEANLHPKVLDYSRGRTDGLDACAGELGEVLAKQEA